MKRVARFMLVLSLCACATQPHNLAESYVQALDPDAVCIRWGQGGGTNDAVLCREKTQLFYCATNANRRTSCQLIVDFAPKPSAAQQSHQTLTPLTSPKAAPAPVDANGIPISPDQKP